MAKRDSPRDVFCTAAMETRGIKNGIKHKWEFYLLFDKRTYLILNKSVVH